MLVQHLTNQGLLDALAHHVRLVRGRFGQYEPIDFFALLLGYAISGERTIADFYGLPIAQIRFLPSEPIMRARNSCLAFLSLLIISMLDCLFLVAHLVGWTVRQTSYANVASCVILSHIGSR